MQKSKVYFEKGLVSIIMPSYNTAPYIAETIQSVLNQTYRNWELIIIDDCSSDNTNEVLLNFIDNRIHIYKNKRNSGAAISRNKALKKAKGEWIAFLDSDDLWNPNKLEHQIRFMEKNHYYFSYTNYEEIDVNGNLTGVKVSGPKIITEKGMKKYCWPGCLTVMYNANKIGIVQIKNIEKNNDYAMWLRICTKANCYLLDEYLAKYRRGRSGSISTYSVIKKIKWHYKLYHDAEEMSWLKSIMNTIKNLVYGLYKKKKFVMR